MGHFGNEPAGTDRDGALYRKFAQAQMSAKNQRYVLGGDMDKCAGIFKAAKEDFLGGNLVRFRSIIEAEVLADAIEQAEEFLRAGYKDAACIIAGVALETAIKDLCNRNGILLAKLDTMNAELAKAGVYNKAMQKQVTAWAGLRSEAAHGNWTAYTKEHVALMLPGINAFIAEHV